MGEAYGIYFADGCTGVRSGETGAFGIQEREAFARRFDSVQKAEPAGSRARPSSIRKSAEKPGGSEQDLPRRRDGAMEISEERTHPRSIWRMIF
jgi:hypothetical protein